MRLADKDMIGSDDALGMTMLPMAAYVDGKKHELSLDLGGEGGGGTINFGLEFIPFGAAAALFLPRQPASPRDLPLLGRTRLLYQPCL